MPSPDPLYEPFAGLCGALRDLHGQVEALARVHDSIDAFNAAFGAFQDAMGLHASCLQFPRAASSAAARPTKKAASLAPAALTDGGKSQATGIPLPQATALPKTPSVSPVAAASASTSRKSGGSGAAKAATKAAGDKSGGSGARRPVATKKRGVKVAAGRGQQRLGKRKAPAPPAWTWEKWILEKVPKKYQAPHEIKKLENIILYIKNRGAGISIADLVKHSGLAVIKCKEILQTLMKLDLIERKHEQSGFVYTFGRSP